MRLCSGYSKFLLFLVALTSSCADKHWENSDLIGTNKVIIERPLTEGIRWDEGPIAEGESEYVSGVQNQALTGVVMAVNEAVDSSFVKSKFQCDVWKRATKNCHYTVLIAISNCIPKHIIKQVKLWIERVRKANLELLTRDKSCCAKFKTIILKSCKAFNPHLIRLKRKKKIAKIFLSETISEDEVDDAEMTNEEIVNSMEEHGEAVLSDDLKKEDLFLKIRVRRNKKKLDIKRKVNAFIGIFGDRKTYRQVIAYEKRASLKFKINFRYCKKGKNCRGKWKKCVNLSNFADITLYSPFKMIQTFHCKKVLPYGVPITYLDGSHNRKCFCRCPSGYKLSKHGKPRCVPDKEKCHCKWRKNKYHAIIKKTNCYTRWCKIKNIVRHRILKYIPYPKSNYVGKNRHNQKDHLHYRKICLRSGPRVEVIITNHKGKQTFRCGYPWKVFQRQRKKIFNSIKFRVPDQYWIKLLAFDYCGKPAKCKTCLALNNRYYSHFGTCPRGFCDYTQKKYKGIVHGEDWGDDYGGDDYDLYDGGYDGGYDGNDEDDGYGGDYGGYHGYYSGYSIRRLNQKCKGLPSAEYNRKNLIKTDRIIHRLKYKWRRYGRCDTLRYLVKDFGSKKFQNRNWRNWKTCFRKKLTKRQNHNMKRVFGHKNKKVNKRIPETAAKSCTRCCKFSTNKGKSWSDFTCYHKKRHNHCTRSKYTCRTKQCLVIFGSTFFKAFAKINSNVVKWSKKLIKSHFPHSGFNAKTQIHLSTKCTKHKNIKECTVKRKLKQLFHLHVQKKKKNPLFRDNANQYVEFRYRVQGWSKWKVYNKHHLLKFSNPVTCIFIEAWSKCGLVRKFNYYVYLHTHQTIKVQEQFRHMWYQATASRSKPGQMCNYMRSDFAELTFDYHPKQALLFSRKQIAWTTDRVTCKLFYKGRKGVSILNQGTDNKQIIKHYSIEMLNKKKTNKVTNIQVDCTFKFKGHKGAKRTERAWIKFSIKNCDDPKWDCPYAKCNNNRCKSNRKAFQSCGGNQIWASRRRTHFTKKHRGCCKKCGKMTCSSLLKIPTKAGDIKRCEPRYRPHSHSNKFKGHKGKGNDWRDWFSYAQDNESINNKFVGLSVLAVAGLIIGVAISRRNDLNTQFREEECDGYAAY